MNESCPFYMNNQVVYSFGLHESSQNIYQMIFNKTGIQTAIFFYIVWCIHVISTSDVNQALIVI